MDDSESDRENISEDTDVKMPDENDDSSSSENDSCSFSTNDDTNISIEKEGVEPWNINVETWYIAQFKAV